MFRLKWAGLCLTIACAQSAGGSLTLRVQDAISVPGKPVTLVADLGRQITLSLRSGKPDVAVQFRADGKCLGTAVTNRNGIATLEIDAGRLHLNTYTAHAVYKKWAVTGEGRWFNWRIDRTVVAVDIDDTVCWTNYGDLFLSDLDRVSKPLDGSADALNHLSKSFYVLYISARPLWLTEKTRQWLDEHGFPPGPVVHRGGWESCLRQQAVKQEILADLRTHLPNLLIGIADRDVDLRAFGSNEMVTMLIRNPELARSGRHAVGFDGWRELHEFFATHRRALENASVLSKSLAMNVFPPEIPQADTPQPDGDRFAELTSATLVTGRR